MRGKLVVKVQRNSYGLCLSYSLTFFRLLEKVQGLLRQHDELKKEESEFKEHCRKDLAALQEQIEYVYDNLYQI